MNKNYVPLYRKYRPQSLDQIVGQGHVKKALANAIEMNRISHAYLFTGPRGTGKTSTARIFAKSLNCINGPTINPCNECENCKNITLSVPIDVIEIDAASNRSVNDADEIIQKVALAPVSSKYKIYIIDEVHMLTPQAFNALLKTLEEPPANVIFILATTEVHKVLDTIKSRCQRFDFKRITTDDIAKHLRYISEQEGINISDNALAYIASNSAGGMRDSIALLDQLSVMNSDTPIDVEDINKLLGRLSFGDLLDLFNAICESNQIKALDIVNNIYNQGNEPTQILSNLLDFMRNALIVKSVGERANNILNIDDKSIKLIASTVSNIDVCQLTSLIEKCANYQKELKLTSTPKLWLDISAIDMANLAQNTDLSSLQKRLSQLESGGFAKQTSAYNTPPAPVMKQEVKIQAQKTVHTVPTDDNDKNISEADTTGPVSQSNSGNDINKIWVDFLENISSFPSRAILKQQALPVRFDENEVIISIKNTNWLKNFGPEGDRYEFIVSAVKKIFGDKLPKIIVRAPIAGDDATRKSISAKDVKVNSENLSVQNESETSVLEESQDFDDVNDAIDQKKNIEISENALPGDGSFHSDGVNMVMDLFEGKIIE